MRSSFKDKPSSLNKENRGQSAHYSFSKNIKAQIIDKIPRKGNTFVDRVNGYIQMISPHENVSRKQSRQNKSIAVSTKTKKMNRTQRQAQQDNRDRLYQKVKDERKLNRNLQKCIIEIQKILWQRNDRLDEIQEELKDRQKVFSKKKFEEQQEASNINYKRMKDTQKHLKRQVHTLGVRQILSKMDQHSEDQEDSSRRNITESSSSFQEDNSFIKIRRPRTQSESETGASRLKR